MPMSDAARVDDSFRLATALFTIFVVGIVNDAKAFSGVVVLTTERHMPAPCVPVVNDISDQVEPPAVGAENSIIVMLGDGHHRVGFYGLAGTRINAPSSHSVEIVVVIRNRWERTLPQNVDCRVAFCDRSCGDPDISDHELYFSKITNFPFVQANTTHNELRAERQGYMSVGGYGGASRHINASLELSSLVYADRDQNNGSASQKGSKERELSRIHRKPASVVVGLTGLLVYIVGGLFGCILFYASFAAWDRREVFLGSAFFGLALLLLILGTLILAEWV
jgi:hypothetical protein